MGTYVSTVTIEELVDGKPGRLLLLSDAGLPYEGVAYPIQGTLPTTWYPGNPKEATQHVLVVQDMPTKMGGLWSRTTLPNSGCIFIDDNGVTSSVKVPKVMVDIFEDFARRMHRLRVTWSVAGETPDETGNIVREGRIDSFTPTYYKIQDIEWAVSFTWLGRGEQGFAPVSTRDDNAVAATNVTTAAMDAAVNAAKALSVTDQPPKSLTLGQLDALAGAPNKLLGGVTRSLGRVVHQFKQAGDILNKVKALPFSLSNQVVDLAHNSVAVARQFIDQLGRQPVELMTLKSSVADMTRGARGFFEVHDAVEIAARRALELEQKFIQAAILARQSTALSSRERNAGSVQSNDILAVYITKDGDTPEKISMRFYSNGDRGLDILRTNKLPFHQPSFKRGIALIIPRLKTSQVPG